MALPLKNITSLLSIILPKRNHAWYGPYASFWTFKAASIKPVYPFSIVVCYTFCAEKKKPSSLCCTLIVFVLNANEQSKNVFCEREIAIWISHLQHIHKCVHMCACEYTPYSVRIKTIAYEKCVGDCELGWITLNSWHIRARLCELENLPPNTSYTAHRLDTYTQKHRECME